MENPAPLPGVLSPPGAWEQPLALGNRPGPAAPGADRRRRSRPLWPRQAPCASHAGLLPAQLQGLHGVRLARPRTCAETLEASGAAPEALAPAPAPGLRVSSRAPLPLLPGQPRDEERYSGAGPSPARREAQAPRLKRALRPQGPKAARAASSRPPPQREPRDA